MAAVLSSRNEGVDARTRPGVIVCSVFFFFLKVTWVQPRNWGFLGGRPVEQSSSDAETLKQLLSEAAPHGRHHSSGIWRACFDHN